MIAPTQAKRYTIDEYLELEQAAETRNEYRDGEIVPMTGGTPEHNEIASIFNAILRVGLKGQPYSIFVAHQRLWFPDHNLYTYPDVMVVRRPLQRQVGRTDTVMNPLMIAEILSRSTQSYDRGDKFLADRTVPTFQEYLLVDQYQVHVEHYVKTAANQWLFSEYDDSDIALTLTSLGLAIQIADLYENIDFTAI